MAIKKQSPSFSDLSSWVDSLQSQGLYYFTRDQALNTLLTSDTAFNKAAARLAIKKRIVRVHRGFFIIIPLEYTASGILPAEWFIADLMSYLGKPYYVGLLSAATLHGAAHQQPQEFHVITTAPLRKIRVRNLIIHFFTKKNIAATPTAQVKVQTGFIPLSTPEATALDLVSYEKAIGGLDRVLTVLQELGEAMDGKKLVAAAVAEGNLAYAQRLGWLLEKAGFLMIAGKLAKWLAERRPLPAKLEPSLSTRGCKKNDRWALLINAQVESDL
jgi:predicted transcriptional regulator of viral defense system